MRDLSDFEKRQRQEIEKRVDYIERHVNTDQSDFDRKNWVLAIGTILICAALTIAGAFM